MKLKKFAAMMLAGVMAVSMLAGCSGKGTNGGNGDDVVVTPGTTSNAVSIFNNNQKATNAVKIEFSSSSSLDNALANAVKAVGNTEYIPGIKVDGDKVQAKEVVKRLIINETGVGLDDTFMTKDTAADGETATLLNVVRYGQGEVGNETAALRTAVAGLSDFIEESDAIASTFEKGNQEGGSKYFDFSYTGDVSVASVENKDGSKVYFVAYTVTQTAAEQTYTK